MQINGKEMDIPAGISISVLLEKLNLGKKSLVVVVNEEVVPKDKYSGTILNPGDRVELVDFVGGG